MKSWRAAVLIALGLALTAVGVWGALADLDAADKIASVIGGAAGLASLALALVVVRRDTAGSLRPAQTVETSTVAGQVADVDGGVSFGRTSPPDQARPAPARPSALPAESGPARPTVERPVSGAGVVGGGVVGGGVVGGGVVGGGGQAVRATGVGGDVRQIRGVGGDVEIDR